jgi:hypothetical protein
MAKTAVQVTEEDYKKNPEGVQKIETRIPGVPEPLVTYVEVQFVDDLLGKPVEGTQTVNLMVPVEAEREEVVIGEDGEPEKNDDGSDKLHVVTYLDYEPREIDLGPASLKKLMTALKPFAEKSRERVVQVPASRPTAASSAGGTNPALREWGRRVRTWLQNEAPASVLGGEEVPPKGQIKARWQEAYVKANPQDPKPV